MLTVVATLIAVVYVIVHGSTCIIIFKYLIITDPVRFCLTLYVYRAQNIYFLTLPNSNLGCEM